MNAPLSITFLVVVAALGAFVRPATLGWRFAFNLVACGLASLLLWRSGQTPLFLALKHGAAAPEIWTRLLGVAWWLLASRAAVVGLRLVVRRGRSARQTRLVSDLLAAGIYAAAIFAVLNSVLGLPVQGLLATSGVIAVVLGLALQSTLADVFAGVAVGVEGPFRVGDRIRLGDRFEGEVVQLNWRSIRLETDDDDVVVIPNSLVAKAEIINRSTPSVRRAGHVEVSCPAHADPEGVIELIERGVMLCPAVTDSPKPSVSLVGLGLRMNRYRVGFFVEDARGLSSAKSHLLRQIRRALHHADLIGGVCPGQAAPVGSLANVVLSPARMFREMGLFERLSDAEIGVLAKSARTLHLDPGDVLFAEGQDDARLFIIASGVFMVARQTPDAQREELGRVGPGDYLGEIALLTGAPLQASASALTHALVYELARDALAPVVVANPDLAAALERSAHRGQARLERQVAILAGLGASGQGQVLAGIRRLLGIKPRAAPRARPTEPR
jgi:small-conductance mechanosensitive channel/CRP-like cAMP-binding protein